MKTKTRRPLQNSINIPKYLFTKTCIVYTGMTVISVRIDKEIEKKLCGSLIPPCNQDDFEAELKPIIKAAWRL